MKWLAERPRPLEEAWNILCDALEERMDHYGFQIDRATIPRVPRKPFQSFNLSAMRNLIISMVKCSFNPQKFGMWCNFSDSELFMNSCGDRRGAFFDDFQIDAGAFHRRSPPVVPSLRHTISQFILAAGQIIDRAIIYPRPAFSSTSYGFVFDADLQLETFSPALTLTGKFSLDGALRAEGEYKGSYKNVYSGRYTLAECSCFGRCRARNLHWSYCRGGELMPFSDTGGYGSYICPVLSGKAEISTDGDRIGVPDFSKQDEPYSYTDLGPLEFEVDFESGCSANYDFSVRQSDINQVWNSDDDLEKLESRTLSADFYFKNRFIRLYKENYPEPSYKYLS